MNKIIKYNNKLINIIWPDRGIKLAIIYNILKYYNKIKNKNIIINNKDYRVFAKIMFPELIIIKFKNNIENKNNFYFNIREIIIKKNIFIDYLYNYTNDNIPTKKLNVIPWFDINDPIIYFRYSKKNFLNFNNECTKIIYFGNINRYINNKLWDNIIEYNILYKYILYKYYIFKIKLNIKIIYTIFFSLLKKYYKKNDKPFIINKMEKETIIINNNNNETVIIDNPTKDFKEKAELKKYIEQIKKNKK